MFKIITTTFKSWDGTGVHKVLRNFQILSNPKEGYEIEFMFIEDAEKLINPQCNLVISCGLSLDRVHKTFPLAKKGLLFCSNFLQGSLTTSALFGLGDLESLVVYLRDLEVGRIDYIFTTSPDIPRVMENRKIMFFPPTLDQRYPYPCSFDRSGVCSIGSIFKHRNLPTLFAAYHLAAPPENLVVNGGEYAGCVKSFSKLFPSLNGRVDIIPRLPEREFFEKVSQSVVGIQLSISETFNLAVYEMAKMRIPVIVSPAIRWYHGPMIDQYLRVQNPDDPVEVADRIKLVVESYHVNREKGLYPILINEGVLVAQEMEKQSVDYMLELIKRLQVMGE